MPRSTILAAAEYQHELLQAVHAEFGKPGEVFKILFIFRTQSVTSCILRPQRQVFIDRFSLADGDQSCAKEARDDRGEDQDATLEATNVTEPIKEVVDFSAVEIGVWVESKVEHCVHLFRVMVQIVWLDNNL